MFEYLDRRYALALYEVAEEKGKVQEYLNDLREIYYLVNSIVIKLIFFILRNLLKYFFLF